MTDPILDPSAPDSTQLPETQPIAPDLTQVPVSEIPGEVKSLEELSGTKDPMQPEVPQATAEIPQTDSKAKLIKIVVPIVVAIALGLGGFLVYSFFIKGEPEGEEAATEETITETPAEEPAVTEGESEELPPELQEELDQSLNAEETPTEEEVAPEEETPTEEEEVPPAETPKVKVPRT